MEAAANDLPRVEGLEAAVQDAFAQDKGQQVQVAQPVVQDQQAAPSAEGQAAQTMSDEEILAQFKSTKDLLKSYKEIQGYTTRVSQENKTLKEKAQRAEELENRLNQLQQEMELRQYQMPQQPVQQKSFEEMFIENPEQAIAMKANEIATIQRIQEVGLEERAKNPQEYVKRAETVQKLALDPRLQHLQYSAQGVRKLFEIADVVRKKETAYMTRQMLNDPIVVETLREKLGIQNNNTNSNPQTNLAYMPDTGTSYRTGQDMLNGQMTEIRRSKEEALQKGDVGGVTRALIQEALNK
jgi:predicted RNase H-like nuclease (RuvC/YqgF family)